VSVRSALDSPSVRARSGLAGDLRDGVPTAEPSGIGEAAGGAQGP